MARRFYVGIDPGKKGAMAIFDAHTRSAITVPFDKLDYKVELQYIMVNEAIDSNDIICCLESVHAMPKQGVSSMFSFGENYGWIQGVLDTLGIPYELVHPQKWKKEFSITADKNTAIEVCRRMFPSLNLKRTERARKDDDNIAEAVLMAMYMYRKFQ